MKKMLIKLGLLTAAALSLVGVKAPFSQATIQPNKQVAEVSQVTPLYLKFGGNFLMEHEKKNQNIKVVQQHYSHMSHRSHYSHYSSRF